MSIFDEIKIQLNIRQVVEHYGFRVNRAGKFICPFHNDHKPSASIKDDYFHCFVCGAGGDLIAFTSKYLGISNFEACKELISTFSLNIEISTQEEIEARNREQRQRKYKSARADKKEYSSRREAFANSRKPAVAKKTRLKAEIRESNLSNERQWEEYMNHAGNVLADMHRFLLQGIHLYPYGHERHDLGLQELTVCEYWIEWFDRNPKDFCIECKGVIEKYERTVNCGD